MKIIFITLFVLSFNTTYAQLGKRHFFKFEGGAGLYNDFKYRVPRQDDNSDNVFNLAGSYNLNIRDRFEIGLGPRIDYIGSLDSYTTNYLLTTLTLQGQFNFSANQGTPFVYSQYGIGPKLGSFINSGNVFEIGLGYKYREKKGLGLSAGYNITNINRLPQDNFGVSYFNVRLNYSF